MRTTALVISRLIACCALAWQPSALHAQEEDTQLWLNLAAETDLAAGTSLTLDGSVRWREDRRGDEQVTLRFNIDQTIAEGVRIGGGAGVFETVSGATELRPHQQITLRLGRFSSRTRIEQRFFDGAQRMELRFRQRIGYIQPIAGATRINLDGEYLGLVQTRNPPPLEGPGPGLDQWRARGSLQSDVSADLTIGGGYLLIFTPQPGGQDEINHIPQLFVTYRF